MPATSQTPSRRLARPLSAALLLAIALLLGMPAGAGTGTEGEAGSSQDAPAGAELSATEAAILGIVEGVTEYLPVSSTGHLYVTERLLGVGTTEATKDAADSYVVVIQAGAILAVVVLYHRRLWSMVEGLLGRDPVGRRILLGVVIAFVPAALTGLLLDDLIKDRLFNAWAIAAAWAVGGVAIIWVSRTFLDKAADTAEAADPTPDDEFDPALSDETDRGGLATLEIRQAVVIGAAQCLALWPGTSRSLVTIVAAVLAGLSLPAAVEFSFLLGLATLGAATLYEGAKSGGEIVDTFGLASPLIGFAFAFGSAVLAVRWMVGYLQRHSFAIFGWYRIGVAALVVVLLSAGTLSA